MLQRNINRALLGHGCLRRADGRIRGHLIDRGQLR
jgi:hypothetical protein